MVHPLAVFLPPLLAISGVGGGWWVLERVGSCSGTGGPRISGIQVRAESRIGRAVRRGLNLLCLACPVVLLCAESGAPVPDYTKFLGGCLLILKPCHIPTPDAMLYMLYNGPNHRFPMPLPPSIPLSSPTSPVSPTQALARHLQSSSPPHPSHFHLQSNLLIFAPLSNPPQVPK
jgi:hypothetical protein